VRNVVGAERFGGSVGIEWSYVQNSSYTMPTNNYMILTDLSFQLSAKEKLF
jgi:hypothetical protein